MEVRDLISDFMNNKSNDNKVARKKCLERFLKDAFKDQEKLSQIFNESSKPLVSCLSDESERCREISAQIFCKFLLNLRDEEIEFCLPYLIPTMKQRLGLEKSEEVRLELNAVLKALVEKKVNMDIYISDVNSLIKAFLEDKNPGLQIQCCSLISSFARNYPEKFSLEGSSLVDPLLPLVSHNQHKVRAAAVGCLGTVVLHGGDLDKVHHAMAARLLDQSPQVRMVVSQVLFSWITDHPDQEYWTPKLLPLALACLEDDSEDIRRHSETVWNVIGERWISGQKAKDIDVNAVPKGKQAMILPGEGCCELVRRYQDLMYRHIHEELNDWTCEKRITASKLLYVVICHVKTEMKENHKLVFDCLETAAKDEEAVCVEFSRKSSYVLGHYAASCQYFSKIAVNSVREESSKSKLVVLGSLVLGSNGDMADGDVDSLTLIADVLAEEDVRKSGDESYQTEFLRCLNILISKADKRISHQILLALLTIVGLAATEEVAAVARSGILDLSDQVGLDRDALFRKELCELLSVFRRESSSWTSNSSSIQVFQAVIEESGPDIYSYVETVLTLLRTMDSFNILEIRKKMLSILELFLSKTDARIYPFILSISADLVQPALVWRTGLTERRIRSSATSCLYQLAQHATQAPGLAAQLAKQVWHQVLALLEDQEEQVRFWICRTAVLLISHIENDSVIKSIEYFMNRLDDSKKFVRLEAFKVLRTICDLDIGESYISRVRKKILEKEHELE